MPTLDSTLQSMVLEVIQDSELFLVDLTIRGRQGSKVVEVYLDGESGVSVDKLTSVSKQLAFLLETADIIKGKYNLNVSSPGSENALKMPRQYKLHAGRTLELTTQPQKEGSEPNKEKGELISATDTEFILKLSSGENRTYTFEEIKDARIVHPW